MKTKKAKAKAEYPRGMHGIVNDPTLKDTRAIVLKQTGTTRDLTVQLSEDCKSNPVWQKGSEVIIEEVNFKPVCVKCGKELKKGSGSIYCPAHSSAL